MLPTVFLPFMMEVVRVVMNEEKKIYVQHKSGVGEKWELGSSCRERMSDRYKDWDVLSKDGKTLHFLPKSEYIICEPPEWRDVTGDLRIAEHGRVMKNVHNTNAVFLAGGYRLKRMDDGSIRVETLCR